MCLKRRLENYERIGENSGHKHYLLFSQCFQRPFSRGHKCSVFFGMELMLNTMT